jgi:outer membrane protein TolC
MNKVVGAFKRGESTMTIFKKRTATVPGLWLQASIVVLSGFLLSGVLKAQDLPANSPAGLPLGSAGPNLLAQVFPKLFSEVKASNPDRHDMAAAPGLPVASSDSTIRPGNPRRITLEQAQQQAAAASNPMAHLAQLQVEAARQHRLGAESDYFPKISSTLTNFHFNKFMGEELTVNRPIAGGTVTAQLPLAGKDQTLIAVTAAQPITPLLKLREVVNIARADERVAMAKAGMPVETANNVEKSYYALLVAQRQLEVARANAAVLRDRQLVASTAAMLPDHEEDNSGAAKALLIASSKVKELTASLNLLLGYPVEGELELVTPVTQVEEISLKEAADKAMAANPEVVEAEQTVAKAHAASKLSKLDYVPDLAVLGGYAYNANAVPLLPRDFSFIGIMGAYNLFDFGKREHTIKERNAQVSMAETAVELTKAKVAAAVKSTYFEMDRSRQLSELARRLSDAIPVERVSYAKNDSELAVSRAKVEIEMLQANLAYRQALAQLKTLMGEQ